MINKFNIKFIILFIYKYIAYIVDKYFYNIYLFFYNL